MIVHLFTLLVATLLDRLVGDPDWLWRRVPHPVALLGRAIDWADRKWNDHRQSAATRRFRGTLAILGLLAVAVLVGYDLHLLLLLVGPLGVAVEAVLVAILLAQKSLADHVRAVARALAGDGVEGGRRAVARIVGRDPDQLDEPAICRAAIESLAENASDGVVAPWLFYLVFGLPGLLAYKLLNTADSMIGHLTERHRAFGWAAARLDDVANFIPARLTALMFAAVAPLVDGSAGAALAVAWRDARLHRSPNAGWPESAVAGALGLSLGGPRRYGELEVDAPALNADGRREATVDDVTDSVRLLRRLSDLLVAILLLLLVLSFL
ncbi:adenosylcobinamide-phosphate synthase CbiB [Aureimonas leprariae]|uniref:Cobalamin biosynthesis protein CobD n=1 Tax=Plantimonas leprariae TaxID=2615207 RepID=A0A7V7PNX4_9HYPH|nr:adenosylcobinamide-phosphate synthase CbiB [Aureimonas leprariae]KAB0679638.1 cobalamin biosynthesis protein [Aureimonas leprariae]